MPALQQMTMRDYMDLPTKISLVCLMFAIGFVLWVLWSILWPFDPLTVYPGSWTTTQKEYKRGEWVIARLDYCQHSKGTPRLDFTMEQSGRLMPLVPAYGNDRAMCEKREAPLLQLPYNALLDQSPVKIHVVITYRANAFREIQYRFETNEFTVVE